MAASEIVVKVRLLLAIDDRPERYAELVGQLLRRGVILIVAEHVHALYAIERLPISAVLLDYDLSPEHEQNGASWARAILDALPSLPVLVVSVNPDGRREIRRVSGGRWEEEPANREGWEERVIGWLERERLI